MNLEELKKQVNKVMEENKPTVIYNSESDKVIRETEKQLTSAGLKQEFSVNLAMIFDEGLEESMLADGKFKLSEYQLIWGSTGDENFRLILKNIPYNNPKILLSLPEQHKNSIAPKIDNFLYLLKNHFQNKS